MRDAPTTVWADGGTLVLYVVASASNRQLNLFSLSQTGLFKTELCSDNLLLLYIHRDAITISRAMTGTVAIGMLDAACYCGHSGAICRVILLLMLRTRPPETERRRTAVKLWTYLLALFRLYLTVRRRRRSASSAARKIWRRLPPDALCGDGRRGRKPGQGRQHSGTLRIA